MNEILDIYNEILEYSKKISSAIKEKEWQKVNLLVSKREDLFQKTNAFVANNKGVIEDNLRTSIVEIIKEIQTLDAESTQLMKENKSVLASSMGKMTKGYKMLKAYTKHKEIFSSEFDENL